MTDGPFWTCPVCMQAMSLEGARYACRNAHAFDRAREGYVNLLPSNHKHSRSPGDAKAMLRSRREFLEQGYYSPLAERLEQIFTLAWRGRTGGPFNLLDTGCGEGYYIGRIEDALRRAGAGEDLAVGGSDIAKEAARMGSRSYPRVHFAVASNNRLPVADEALDCALRVFAPGDEQELKRILKPGGLFINVTPGARHLHALRALVYDRPRSHQTDIQILDGFEHAERHELDYELIVDRAGDVGRLFSMTPYYWQTDQERQQRILGLERLETEAAFLVDVYRKRK